MTNASDTIKNAVSSWEGIEVYPHRFGGIEFRIGKREIGHLHGNHMADLPFPTKIRHELVAQGRAQPHHLLKDSGWVSYYIRNTDDVTNVIELFRLNYGFAVNRGKQKPMLETE